MYKMEKNLTPLLKSIIHIGATLQTCSTDESLHMLKYVLNDYIPEGCSADIDNLEVYLKDIKDENRLRIADITEILGVYFVDFDNGLSLIYNGDITHK